MAKLILSFASHDFAVVNWQSGTKVWGFTEKVGNSPYGIVPVGGSNFFHPAYYPEHGAFAVLVPDKALFHIHHISPATDAIKKIATTEILNSLCFTSCSQFCVGGGQTGNVYCWDTFTGQLKKCWKAHASEVFGVALTPDNQYLLTASRHHGTIVVYPFSKVLDYTSENVSPDVWTKWCLPVAQSIVSLACVWVGDISPHKFGVFVGTSSRTVSFLVPGEPAPMRTVVCPAQVLHLAVNPTLFECYICCEGPFVYAYAFDALTPADTTSAPSTRYDHSPESVTLSLVSKEGSVLVVATNGPKLHFWSTDSTRQLLRLMRLDHPVVAMHLFINLRDVNSVSVVDQMRSLQRVWSNELPLPRTVCAPDIRRSLRAQLIRLLPSSHQRALATNLTLTPDILLDGLETTMKLWPNEFPAVSTSQSLVDSLVRTLDHILECVRQDPPSWQEEPHLKPQASQDITQYLIEGAPLSRLDHTCVIPYLDRSMALAKRLSRVPLPVRRPT